MMRRRDLLLLGLTFGAMAFGILRLLPDAIDSTASIFLDGEMTIPAASPWTDRLDSVGNPHTSTHRDGHKVGLFPDGWFAYHVDHRWTPPGTPRVGPMPAGPFNTLTDAKAFVEAQGFISTFPFELANQSAISA
jgi:hypothetical protein